MTRGYCWNEDNRVVDSEEEACAVGIIRAGRTLGNYAIKTCGECPYFRTTKWKKGEHPIEYLLKRLESEVE